VEERCQKGSGPDQSVSCLFCGKTLERRTLAFAGRVIYGGIQDCNCAASVAAMDRIEQEVAYEQRRLEADERQKKIAALFYRSGIGARFQDRTFATYHADTPQKQAAVNVAHEFVEVFETDRRAQGLFFYGSVGTGKTHLAAAIANEVMTRLMAPVLFGTSTALLSRIKSGWADKSDEEALNMLCTVPLLIIDDLGKEYAKRNADGWSWVHEQLYHVINRRYEDYLPVIVTTNFDLPELEKKIDASVVSRIIESCRGVECDWEDHRCL